MALHSKVATFRSLATAVRIATRPGGPSMLERAQAMPRLVRAVRSGDHGAARDLDARLQPLWSLFREFSSLRVMYACANALGRCRLDPPRPILPLPEFARDRVVQTLRSLELH